MNELRDEGPWIVGRDSWTVGRTTASTFGCWLFATGYWLLADLPIVRREEEIICKTAGEKSWGWDGEAGAV